MTKNNLEKQPDYTGLFNNLRSYIYNRVLKAQGINAYKLSTRLGLNEGVIPKFLTRIQSTLGSKAFFALADYLEIASDILLGRKISPPVTNKENILDDKTTLSVPELIAKLSISDQEAILGIKEKSNNNFRPLKNHTTKLKQHDPKPLKPIKKPSGRGR